MTTKIDSLKEIMMEIFPSHESLISFLQSSPELATTLTQVNMKANLKVVTLETLENLFRRGLISKSFFLGLIKFAPRLTNEIKSIENAWFNEEEWSEVNESSSQLKTKKNVPKVFVWYSHRDVAFYDDLSVHLNILMRKKIIDVFQEARINAGEKWKSYIDQNFFEAEIIILLVSPDFLTSEFDLKGEKFSQLIERQKEHKTSVIPIIVRNCIWQQTPIAEFQVIPRDGKPLSNAKNLDRAWIEVSTTVMEAAKKWRSEK